MSQCYLTIDDGGVFGNSKKPHMIKTYSFNTDDDDAAAGVIPNSSKLSNQEKLSFSNNGSIDTNNNDDYSSETSTKIRRRKSRQQQQQPGVQNDTKKNVKILSKSSSWYNKFRILKLLLMISVLIFLYVFWTKREIWIQRLLKSNARSHRVVITKTEEIIDSSSPIEDPEEKNDQQEDLISSIELPSTEKSHFKIRRNKINFHRDDPKPKNHSSINPPHHSSKLSNSSSLISSSKQHSSLPFNTSTIHFSTYDDILQQLRRNLKSQRHNREFFLKFSKQTGLTKDQLYRFIYKKDFQRITLPTFLTILDAFNLFLVIVPK